MNAQVDPTIENTRLSLCAQLIGAGMTDAQSIIANAKSLESFIYGGAETAEKKTVKQTAETKTTAPVAEEKQAEVQTEAPAESDAQNAYTLAEIKTALMRVAKADYAHFKSIMDQYSAAQVTQIQSDDYPAVIAAVEKFEAENA